MLVTGSQIATNALTTLGINEQGGVPSASDLADAITELNNLWDAWSVDEGLIYEQIAARFPLTANIASYTIGQATTTGPAGAFNIQPPSRIYKARVITATGGAIGVNTLSAGGTGYAANDTGVVLGANGTQATYTVNTIGAGGAVATYTLNTAGTGYTAGYGLATRAAGGQTGAGTGFRIDVTTVTAGGETRVELEVVSADRYLSHRDLQASAQTPDELYPDYNPDENGLERLFLFPIPNAAATLELEMAVTFATWLATTAVGLPPAAADALTWALAWRLIPRYGLDVSQQIVESVGEMATKSEARFRDAVAKNRQIPEAAVQPAGQRPTPPGGE